MKICKFEINGEFHWGELTGDAIRDLGPATSLVPDLADSSAHRDLSPVDRTGVRLVCPVSPSKIVCVGRNYAAHAAELGNQLPEFPLLFLKAPTALCSDGDAIIIPTYSDQVEHEGELGVVIGRDCSKLGDEENPFDYVTGFVALNDVTARDIQKRETQFTRAKSFDTFCPVSNVIETSLDVRDVRVMTRVNGELRQDGRTSQMTFPVDYLIRYISRQMTLKAGDLIATGTPSGVSKLNPGDVCEIEIEGIGILSNKVAIQ